MDRIEVNVMTGEKKVIALTQAEIDASVAAKAADDAFNTPDNIATRALDSADKLWFEVCFSHENRVRALEAKAAITRAQYRTALIGVYKTL